MSLEVFEHHLYREADFSCSEWEDKGWEHGECLGEEGMAELIVQPRTRSGMDVDLRKRRGIGHSAEVDRAIWNDVRKYRSSSNQGCYGEKAEKST